MRKLLAERPMLGWIVAAVLMLGTAFMLWRQLSGGETAELSQMVTIRDTETGETWEMSRGSMEKELYMRSFPVDPNEGLTNPKTGKKTGFPVDDWKATITRINAERKDLAEGGGSAFGNPAPARPR